MTEALKTITVLFKAQQSFENRLKEHLIQEGINVNEFAALEALYSKGSMTTQKLCDSVLIPNSSMTYVVDQLEKKGFVKRERDPVDRRIVHVSFSQAGYDFFSPIFKRHMEDMMDVMESLSLQDHKNLQENLKIIGKRARNKQ